MSPQHSLAPAGLAGARLPEAQELTSLVERMAAGDHDAAAAFYDATAAAVFSLVSIFSSDSAGAEALTCQVYVEAWTRAPAFAKAEESATAWLAALVGEHVQRAGVGHDRRLDRPASR